MIILTTIWNFIKDPANRSKIYFVGIAILIALLLHQCNVSGGLKQDIATEKATTERIQNNALADKDTIKNLKDKNGKIFAEKQGYMITATELKGKYSSLYSDFLKEKGKPPKTIIDVQYVTKEKYDSVATVSTMDTTGHGNITVDLDSKFDTMNYRKIYGSIPYKAYLINKVDGSIVEFDNMVCLKQYRPYVNSGKGMFILDQGMNLDLGLAIDKNEKVYIKAQTNYPGVTFTNIHGAYIMDDPASSKITRQFRKTWSIGLSAGYGVVMDFKHDAFATGPYLGVGVNYAPKWLQWGK